MGPCRVVSWGQKAGGGAKYGEEAKAVFPETGFQKLPLLDRWITLDRRGIFIVHCLGMG